MSTETAEATKALESLSLGEVHKAFQEAIALGNNNGVHRSLTFGNFCWGEPICVQFVFEGYIHQEQLEAMIARATAHGLRMRPLDFSRKELVFFATTMLLKP